MWEMFCQEDNRKPDAVEDGWDKTNKREKTN